MQQIKELLSGGYPITQIQREIPALASMSYPVLARYIQRFLMKDKTLSARIVSGSEQPTTATGNLLQTGGADPAQAGSPSPFSGDVPAKPSDLQNCSSKPALPEGREPLKLDIRDRLGKRFVFDSNAGNELLSSIQKDKL